MKIYKNLLGIISLPLIFLFLTACKPPEDNKDPSGSGPGSGPHSELINFSFTQEIKGFHSYSAQITADHNTTATLVVSESSSAPSLASINNDAKVIRNFVAGTARKVTFITNEHFTQVKLTAAKTASTNGGLVLSSTDLSLPAYDWLLLKNTSYHLYIYYGDRTLDHPFHTPNDYSGVTQIILADALTTVGVSDGVHLISGNALEVKTGEVLGVPIIHDITKILSAHKDGNGGLDASCSAGTTAVCVVPHDLVISFGSGAPHFTNRLLFLLPPHPSVDINVLSGGTPGRSTVTTVTG